MCRKWYRTRFLVNHPHADRSTNGVVEDVSCNRRVNYQLSIFPGKLPGKPLKCPWTQVRRRSAVRLVGREVASRTRFTSVIDLHVQSPECGLRQSRKLQLSRVHSTGNGIDIGTCCSIDGYFCVTVDGIFNLFYTVLRFSSARDHLLPAQVLVFYNVA